MEANEVKFMHVTKEVTNCFSVKLNDLEILQKHKLKYRGMYLSRRLTWKKNLFTKCHSNILLVNGT